jgi:MFS family permease
MVKTHVEESLGANPGDAALNPADSVAMGVPAQRAPLGVLPPRTGMFSAFRHAPFRLLFAAFLVNQTGFWVSHISLQGLMVELTDNDTSQNGLLFFVLFLPAFVLAPLAGVAADRFDRKRIVLASYAAVCAASAVLASLTYQGLLTPNRMLAVAFGMGIAFTFSGPASMAIAANSVPDDDLPSAVSLQSAANNLTRVMGPLVAAPFLATGRYELSFVFFLVASLIASGLTAAMRVRAFVPEEGDSGIFSRMRSGFDHARERHPVLPSLTIVAVMSYFGVSHTVLIPAYAEEVLGDRAWFSWLVAATGIGAMLGALRVGQSRRAPSLSGAAVGLAIYGVVLGIFAASPNVAVALGSQLLVGFFYFAVMTSLQTLIQQLVDESKRGRVMSLFQVSWAGLVPFGSLTLGLMAGPLGTAPTLGISAGVCFAYGAVMMWWVREHEVDASPRASGS